MFSNPPTWLKRRVKVAFDSLDLGRESLILDLRRRGIVAFWRGWWLIDVAFNELPDCDFLEFEVIGDGGGGRRLKIKLPVSSARTSKRLFFADWRLGDLVLRPAATAGRLSIQRVTISPVLRRFAKRLVYGVLAHGSRGLRGEPLRDLSDLLVESEGNAQVSPDHRLFAHYDEALSDLFEGGIRTYQRWMKYVEPQLVEHCPRAGSVAPLISIAVAVHDPDEAHLRSCIESVFAQTYTNWELCIADDASQRSYVRAVIDEYAHRDARVKVVYCNSHGHISVTSNRALTLATGDFVTFLDHDDELAPTALSEIVCEIRRKPELDIIYSDEDFIDPKGNRRAPHFKSDWNPYLLYSHNYVTHLCVYRRALVDEVGGFRTGVEGAQDYDLLLRCSRYTQASRILHIPKILYHWRMTDRSTASGASRKGYTHAAGKRALLDYFSTAHVPVRVDATDAENFYRVTFLDSGPLPLVTLIIPTRDRVELLAKCVEGILERTDYRDLEILIVDNGSVEAQTQRYLQEIAQTSSVRVARLDEPFNFSRICNFAAGLARGEILGLLNNDVDVISSGWLDEMVMLARRPDVGCVGAKLYYADETVQHAGVILGLGGYAAHSHRCFPRGSGGYFNRLKVRQNVSAVTGACLVVRKAVYEQVDGMDERLTVAYNDVDFCLKVLDAGYLNVFTPFAELYHFESKTRGYDDTAEKQVRFQREKDYLRQKWGDRISLDPYYNPNLTHAREDFSIGL